MEDFDGSKCGWPLVKPLRYCVCQRTYDQVEHGI